ncbi:hypothetical protein [Anaeromyxobacter paludicola]|uniref:Peroxiredoxin n=1 Tax=Anaeromyxobacter paludicola TaxID=2918171 RepID=A0ABM7XEW8_9BACT|nr:hypothetical protein [Anaeromyxobacter paludicola]BDG10395.1 hypothetical protein AMPC_35080 [Anaeromyxobacter paludicola]
MPQARVAIFLSHDDPVALRLAGSCAATAAARGDRVDVFAFGPALPALVEAAAHGEREGGAALLVETRASAEGCRLLACSASLVEQKVSPDAAETTFDAVVGWPTVMEWSRGVVDRFFF